MSEYCRDCERLSQDCDALSADNNKLTARVEELEVMIDDSVPLEAFAALEARCRELEAALLDIAEGNSLKAHRYPNELAAEVLASASETPAAMHARIITETADAIAKERGLTAETQGEHLVKYGDETVEISTDPAGKDPGCSIVYRRLPNGNIEIMGEQFTPANRGVK